MSPGEHRPSLQTLHCTPHQHGHGSAHLYTSPAPVAQSTPPQIVFSAPSRRPSEVLDQTPPGLQKPCRVSCWQLDTSLAVAWQQRLRLLCPCLGRSQTGNRWLTPTVLWFSHPQHLIPACHTPSHHALPCNQCLHSLHGRFNLHIGSDILILGSWQSQHAADKRTDPSPHHLGHSVGHTQTER